MPGIGTGEKPNFLMPTIDLIHKGQIQPSKVTIEGPEPTYVPTAKADIHLGWHSVNYDNGSGLAKNGDTYTGKPLKPGTYNIRFIGNGGFPKHEVEVTYRQVLPAPSARWNGTISDNGSVDKNVADMKSLGFDTIRIWASWDEQGKLTDPKDITTANAYIDAGVNVILQLTPKMNLPTVPYPTAARDAICKPRTNGGLDRRAKLFLINEPNIDNVDAESKHSWYWPNGNWRDAFAMASRLSSDFQPAGFETGSPCFTWQTAGDIGRWWGEAIAKGWSNFDYIDGHNYPKLGSVADKVAEFEAVLVQYKAVAKLLGKNTACSEWGMYGDKSKFAEAFPLFDAVVKKHTDASAYFIMRETTAHSKYGLHLIDAGGNRTALGTAAAAVASQPVA